MRDILIKFYKVMGVPILLYACESWRPKKGCFNNWNQSSRDKIYYKGSTKDYNLKGCVRLKHIRNNNTSIGSTTNNRNSNTVQRNCVMHVCRKNTTESFKYVQVIRKKCWDTKYKMVNTEQANVPNPGRIDKEDYFV